jgi:hypothetical protein
MPSEETVVFRRPAVLTVLGTIVAVAVMAWFAIQSIHDGFNVEARPWAARRLWMWYLSAYVLCPIGIVMFITSLVRQTRQRFAFMFLHDGHVTFDGYKAVNFPLDQLDTVVVGLTRLTFVLKDKTSHEIRVLGMSSLVERLVALKPDLKVVD